MSSAHSFCFIFSGIIFTTFLLTSCISDPEWKQKDDFTFSEETNTSSWHLSAREELLLSYFSGEILSENEAEIIRTLYASGESREIIPYAIFGSGAFSIAEMEIFFSSSPYIPYEKVRYERISDEDIRYLENQKEKAIDHYNTLFWKTTRPESLESASGTYACLTMDGRISKTDGIFWIYTEISAIWDIPVLQTPLSEQFPLYGSAYNWWTDRWSPMWAGGLITDTENMSDYRSRLPTTYEFIGNTQYFVFAATYDNKGISYDHNINNQLISETEGVYFPTLEDCAISNISPPSHFTIHFVPPEEYTWSGQTQLDYRSHTQVYRLQLPWTQKLEHAIFTTNEWLLINAHIFEMALSWNHVVCSTSNYNCPIRFTPDALKNITSLELFYARE